MTTQEVLSQLKDFQRTTVDYVFERLYGPEPTRRFLVADEVGLGKTLIARGVAARAIDHLRERGVPRIDVVYICSNADIARQNINRLVLPGENHLSLDSRLTLLPIHVGKLKENTGRGVNFISLTPSTSLDPQGGLGRSSERALLYCMLQRSWSFGRSKAPLHVLRGNVRKPENFQRQIDYFAVEERIDEDAYLAFEKALRARDVKDGAARQPTMRERFEELCGAYAAINSRVSDEDSTNRWRLVSDLRALLAESCIDALEPDLIILDEFQRFSHVFDQESEAAALAHSLFSFPEVRLLLLSATPYKMYTLNDEASGDDHYRDFLRTLAFLEQGHIATSPEPLLDAYREALYRLGSDGGPERIAAAKGALETRLRRTIARTERLASTADRSGMLQTVGVEPGAVSPSDYLDYCALKSVADGLGAGDVMELWKSAPYLMNFMRDEYELKRAVSEAIEEPEDRADIARSLRASPGVTLPWGDVERYRQLDPRNARMRALIRDTIETGAWSLLWMPPSLPYYALGGAFAAAPNVTKQLVFSAWRVVPRAIAAMLSYEAERRMHAGDEKAQNTAEARRRRGGLLRFSRADGRLTGMPVLALLYPSHFLAHCGDPALLAAERASDATGSEHGAATELLELAKERIEIGLERLHVATPSAGPVDERWYWAAPLLLDRQIEPEATRAWLDQPDLPGVWSRSEQAVDEDDDAPPRSRARADEDDDEGENKHWAEHVSAAIDLVSGKAAELGRMPEDLVDVLARLALAGPAVSMFRAIKRVVGGSLEEKLALRNGAAQAAWAFRSLFNQREVMAMLRANRAEATPYWQLALEYCVDGCLQAVLDEYVHVLRDSLGLLGREAQDRVDQIVGEISTALGLRTARVGVDEVDLGVGGRTVRLASRNLRTHFALRFTDDRAQSDDSSRGDQVRRAFNSPFWPFVLATTSVGQEGLDFHPYCHRVVHWNLPANPVDLEQREGRVHRYKGHAVRKNVAQVHGLEALARVGTREVEDADPWETMFRIALERRPDASSHIIPFWVFPADGGASIERRVLSLPLSRDRERELQLGRWIATYRMVFGQPRQEDLMRYLLNAMPQEKLETVAKLVGVDLSPPPIA